MGHSLVFKHIPSDDVNLTPFHAFKKWTSDHGNYSSSFDIKIKRAMLDEDWAKYDYPQGFAREYLNPDGTDQKTLWYNINGMYYKETKNHLDIEYSEYMHRTLHATASYVQLPQQYVGEGVKLRSVNIVNGSVNIKDDGFGNLYDIDLNTGSMVPTEDLLGYWGFNDKFKYNSQLTKYEYGIIENALPGNDLGYINTTFEPGIKTTGPTVQSTGLKARLNGSSSIYLDEADDYNFKFDEDFAISLWTEIPASQTELTGSYNWLVSKEGDIRTVFIDKKSQLQRMGYTPYNRKKYPFAIKLHNQLSGTPGKIEVSRCDVSNTPTITSVTSINNGAQHHIVFNKVGSTLELWINGVKEGTTTDTTKDNTHNDAILTFGSNGYNKGGLVGTLDEMRIYNRGLSAAEILSLGNMDYDTGTAYNTAIVGNVFYPQGTMVISDPRPKYQTVLIGNNFDYTSSADDNFTLEYRSTVKYYENEILCRIAPGEFNFTANPTVRQYNDLNSQFAKPFVTGSDWHPYVTTVGLYDDYGRLLAVGKTAQAIPILDDIETTFVVRYDE